MSSEIILLTLHVLGAGLVFGVTFLAVAALLKPPVTLVALERLRFIAKFGMWGSIWQFLTGLGLAGREWDEFSGNPIFWTKMALYLVGGLVVSKTLGDQAKKAGAMLQAGQSPTGQGIRLAAWLQALMIVAIITLGVTLVSGGE